MDYYLDRYDLVNNSNSIFTGMNNTAFNAVLPAKNILLGVAVICAFLLFLNVVAPDLAVAGRWGSRCLRCPRCCWA